MSGRDQKSVYDLQDRASELIAGCLKDKYRRLEEEAFKKNEVPPENQANEVKPESKKSN
jgi:hypothetical protein